MHCSAVGNVFAFGGLHTNCNYLQPVKFSVSVLVEAELEKPALLEGAVQLGEALDPLFDESAVLPGGAVAAVQTEKGHEKVVGVVGRDQERAPSAAAELGHLDEVAAVRVAPQVNLKVATALDDKARKKRERGGGGGGHILSGFFFRLSLLSLACASPR